jgi:hypothetical protein
MRRKAAPMLDIEQRLDGVEKPRYNAASYCPNRLAGG